MPYYAVAKGRKPGIYRKWAQCKPQVEGFPRNEYRKRCCYEDAKRFLRRRGVRAEYDCGNFRDHVNVPKSFYYAVAIGRNPGIYHMQWDQVKDQVFRFSNREYRKYYCLSDARYFMKRRCPLEKYYEY